MLNIWSDNINTVSDIKWMLDEKENATTEKFLSSGGENER
jgi:hypothetical protein